jgi:molybdopterin converting factor small subunit
MIVVYVRYFGKLRELLGVRKEEYAVDERTSLMDLLVNRIPQKHPGVFEAWTRNLFRTVKGELAQNKDGVPVLGNYLITLNGKSASLREKMKEGDEVAVMPPFGGG